MDKPAAKETVSEFSQPNKPRQAPQTQPCFVIPVGAMDTIRDCVKEAPFKSANQVLAFLSTCEVMQVPVKVPDGD